MGVAKSRLGLGQHRTKERRVPPGVYPTLLQQKKYHLRGRRQIHHHVLQEGTQGLILYSQARHEEPRTFEEMLAITNKYALAEEATLCNTPIIEIWVVNQDHVE
jgi:hypothetical protein